jgi:hypothetical protein
MEISPLGNTAPKYLSRASNYGARQETSTSIPPKLAQVLMKDLDDATSPISIIIGQCLVAASLGVGLV